ncbi:MAG: hypothetical protein H6677_24155 [Candidatus Obscuribacterales bacterium]|nr:hypothetical protein [Candidatus Obscuribacterales bacterium]
MTNDFDKGCSIYQSASAARDRGLFAEAMKLYDDALALLKPVVEAPLIICLYFDRALAQDLGGDSKLALRDFHRALSLYRELKYSHPGHDGVENLFPLICQIEEQIERMEKVLGQPDKGDYLDFIRPRRWPADRLPLTIYIDAEDEDFPELSSVLFNGFTIWNERTGILPCRLVESAVEASILVVKDPLFLGPAGGQTTYESFIDDDGVEWLLRAYIMIASVERSKVEALAAHEAGHALGLDGHSPHALDLMYFKSPLEEPSSRDIMTLKAIYS